MKKAIFGLIISLFCCFMIYAEDSDNITVKLDVEPVLTAYFTDDFISSASGSISKKNGAPVSLNRSEGGVDYTGKIYATIVTNRENYTAKLEWNNLNVADTSTTIPLAISVENCYVNGSSISQSAADVTTEQDNGSSSLTLTNPEGNGKRVISHELKLSISEADYNKANGSDTAYSTTLKLTVSEGQS